MEIRRIRGKRVTDTVKRLFLECNYEIGQDILDALGKAQASEPSWGREVLSQLLKRPDRRPGAASHLPGTRVWLFLFVEYGDKS